MQSELPLAAPAPKSVKARQMEALRMAYSVIVDLENGTLKELRGLTMRQHPAWDQWAIPNKNWLVRIKHGIANLRGMLGQHARERRAMLSVITEILRESRPLSVADIPDEQPVPRPAAPDPADYAGIFEPLAPIADDDDGWDEWDADNPPF